ARTPEHHSSGHGGVGAAHGRGRDGRPPFHLGHGYQQGARRLAGTGLLRLRGAARTLRWRCNGADAWMFHAVELNAAIAF
ncbi:MAG: hypothetical protein ACREYC_17970, partial [Gammaproteobacteria bacterium]